MILGSTLHDGKRTTLRHSEGQTLVSPGYVVLWAGRVGVGGKDQRLLGSAAAGLNLRVGIWQVYLQGVLDPPAGWWVSG